MGAGWFSPTRPTRSRLAARLRRERSREELLDLASRHGYGDERRRRADAPRRLARARPRFGHGVRIGRGALATHPETFEIGDGVFIGEQAFIQGRFDGRCVIGDHVWIGPQSYFDARDLVIEDYVGWGPGAKVLGSTHTGCRSDVPIIQTDLEIKPVRICAWADVGVNAVRPARRHRRQGRDRRRRRRRHRRRGAIRNRGGRAGARDAAPQRAAIGATTHEDRRLNASSSPAAPG